MSNIPSIGNTFSYEAIQRRQNGQGPLPQSRPNVATVPSTRLEGRPRVPTVSSTRPVGRPRVPTVSSTRPEGRPRVPTVSSTRPDGQPPVPDMFHQTIPRAFQCSSCAMRFTSARELEVHAESH
ncbi:hypothetical protein CRE_17579 [Caenorhabditis remanei]|uniref:Uncharacterized protein n=1 Tax=Caenorhabditis remanei TaxID=31234 RepID=E3NF51_CAERE|nr:hypothetical protein CRE_17579 [Caenorhabditis remanei]